MNEWRKCKLGDILTLQRGHDLPVKDIQEGDFPVAGSNGIIGYHNDFTTEGDGITIGRSGNSIGVSHFYKKRFWAHNTVLYVKKNHGAIPEFIFYLFKTLDLKVLNTGSAIPSLNRNHVHMIDVYIPSSIHEQKAIASVLSSLDDKIDLLHRQNKTLEAMAEALFRQWFVEEAGEDWEEITIGETLTVKGGSTPSTKISEYWDGDIHWTTPKDLSKNNSIYLFDTDRKISLKGLSKISSGLLSKGTLLLSSRAPVGYLAFSKVPLAINQGYIAIIDNKDYSRYFIYLWLKLNMEYVKSYSNGSTFQEISKTSFKSLQLLAPPKDKRSKFDEIIKPLFEKIELNADQILTLERLRDTLLPKLMSGEVRVAC